jgi:hypothetical protein
MRFLRCALAFSLLSAILVSLACSADQTGMSSSGLLAGSKPVAKVGEPAVLDLQLQPKLSDQAQLELTVSSTVVHPHENYIIKVTENENGKPVGAELGSFSFYPPPTKDQPRKFLVDVPKTANLGKNGKPVTQLTVELVPADKTKSDSGSEIRILSARVVQP